MPNWYVVATKPRQELQAESNLLRQGYEVLLPRLMLRKRRRGKWQQIVEPLFPGYLFVHLRLGSDDLAPIRSTIGCRDLVRFGYQQVPVPTGIIEPLLAMGNTPQCAEVSFRKGDVVTFEQGPFSGLTAVFKMARGEDRAQVLINILGKAREITVPMNDLSSS